MTDDDKHLPHPLDVALGMRIKSLREAAGMSQSMLGQHLGVSFPQVQKYESGANRVVFSRLVEVSKALSITTGELIEPVVPDAANPVQGIDYMDMLRDTEVRLLLVLLIKFKKQKSKAVQLLICFIAGLVAEEG